MSEFYSHTGYVQFHEMKCNKCGGVIEGYYHFSGVYPSGLVHRECQGVEHDAQWVEFTKYEALLPEYKRIAQNIAHTLHYSYVDILELMTLGLILPPDEPDFKPFRWPAHFKL